MRKGILTTAVIGGIALCAAVGISQSDTVKTWLAQSNEVYNNSVNQEAQEMVDAEISQQGAPLPVITDPIVQQQMSTQGVTTAANDTATTSTDSETTAPSTPVDLSTATEPAAGDEAAAAPATDVAAATTTEEPKAEASADKPKLDLTAAMVEHAIGVENAPVTVYDYSSLTCPHCANFHNTILPKIKENYIDKGLVRWVYRAYPLNEGALRGEMVARCAPPEQYVKIVDMLFENQARWAFEQDAVSNLSILVRVAGFNDETFMQCMDNKDLQVAIITKAQEGAAKYGIQSTPTFVFNDGAKKISGAGTYEAFVVDLEDMLKGAAKKDEAPPAQTEIPAEKLDTTKTP